MSRLSLKHLTGDRIGIQQINELTSTREVNSGTIWAKDISLIEGSQEPTESITIIPQPDENESIDILHGFSSEEDRKIPEAKGLRK